MPAAIRSAAHAGTPSPGAVERAARRGTELLRTRKQLTRTDRGTD
jgi:hypothetical protein